MQDWVNLRFAKVEWMIITIAEVSQVSLEVLLLEVFEGETRSSSSPALFLHWKRRQSQCFVNWSSPLHIQSSNQVLVRLTQWTHLCDEILNQRERAMLAQRRSRQVRTGMLFSTNTNTNTNHSWKNAQTRLCYFFCLLTVGYASTFFAVCCKNWHIGWMTRQ